MATTPRQRVRLGDIGIHQLTDRLESQKYIYLFEWFPESEFAVEVPATSKIVVELSYRDEQL